MLCANIRRPYMTLQSAQPSRLVPSHIDILKNNFRRCFVRLCSELSKQHVFAGVRRRGAK